MGAPHCVIGRADIVPIVSALAGRRDIDDPATCQFRAEAGASGCTSDGSRTVRCSGSPSWRDHARVIPPSNPEQADTRPNAPPRGHSLLRHAAWLLRDFLLREDRSIAIA